MKRYAFEAAWPDGRRVRRTVSAHDEIHAEALIEADGMVPVRLVTPRWPPRGTGPLPRRELAAGLRSVATLVESGVPADKALRATAQVVSRRLAMPLESAARHLTSGSSFSDALERAGLALPAAALGLVHAGEAGSRLDRGMVQAADHLEREAALAERVRHALAYPAVLLVTGLAALAVILGAVVPRFAELLRDLEQAPPLATRVLLGVSLLIREHGVWLATGGALVALAGTTAARNRGVRESIDRMALELPIVGPLLLLMASGRVSSALGAMVSAGVPLLSAVRGASPAAANAALAARLERAARRTSQGERFHRALEAERALAPQALTLLAIGENSGRLGPMALRAGELAQAEAERRLERLTTLLEPVLILIFAGMVGFVAIAMLQALYSLRPGSGS